jgi:hypothetical protein
VQVFLGGVSKPAGWREKIVIPLLDDATLTYFNPQVAYFAKHVYAYNLVFACTFVGAFNRA